MLNKNGKRFMFDDIPDNYKAQTSDSEDEAWRYVIGDKNARRPPELLTRDHVARCIVREVREGRGSPHGGVFLDIAWIKSEEVPKQRRAHQEEAAQHVSTSSSLSSPTSISTQEPMEIGPTTHYMMGGARVDGDTPDDQRSPGCSRLGNAPRDSMARTDWVAIRYRICWSSACGRASTRRGIRQGKRAGPRRYGGSRTAAAKQSLAPFDRDAGKDPGPYQVQHDLQDMMQDLVGGIVRREDELQRALVEIEKLEKQASRVAVYGNREYNGGWHTALDLGNLLTVSEAITRAAIERKEKQRRAFPR